MSRASLTGKWLLALGTAGAVVALDQSTKAVVVSRMELHQSIPVVESFFALTYVRNTGAAFGLFAGRLMALQVPFFLLVSVFAVTLLFWFLHGLTAERRLVVAACGAVIGGATGNMIDRVAFGEVIDFLDLFVGSYHWPAFNVADMAISLGVIVLCLDAVRQPEPARAIP
ncbi:MAG: signal peptidase II [Candidatus Binatia bacterium]